MKGPSTEIIHRGEGGSRTAEPLTLPIYETTTFLFESAAEVFGRELIGIVQMGIEIPDSYGGGGASFFHSVHGRFAEPDYFGFNFFNTIPSA